MTLMLYKFWPVAGVGLTSDIPALDTGMGLWVAVSVYFSLLFVGLVANVAFFSKAVSGVNDWRVRLAALRARPWTWREAGILLMIFLSMYLALQLFNRFFDFEFSGEHKDASPFPDILAGVVIYSFGIALILWSVFRRDLSYKAAFGVSMKNLRGRIGQGVVCYASVLPYVFIVSLAFQVFLRVTNRDIGMQDSMKMFLDIDTPFEFWSFLALAIIGAPVFEELVFRGIIFPLTAKKIGVGAAVVVSSALFAIVHFHFASFAALFVLSVGFSLAYVYTGSMLAPMVMHALFNGVNLGLLLLFAGG